MLGAIPMDEINRPTSAVIRIRDLSDDVSIVYILPSVTLTSPLLFHTFTHPQAQAAYIFDPGVITFDSIALSAINTSFYTLEGASDNQSALIVETLVGEVCLLAQTMKPCTKFPYYISLNHMSHHSLCGALRHSIICQLLLIPHINTQTTFFGSFWARSLQCPPGYTLSQLPQETDYRTCACNFDNNKILECDGRDILLEVCYSLLCCTCINCNAHTPGHLSIADKPGLGLVS